MPAKCLSKERPKAVSRSRLMWTALLLAGAALTAVPALAQDSGSVAPPIDGAGIVFELGGGGVVSPSYEGSSRYIVSPYPTVRLNYLRLNNGFQIGGGDGQGWSFRPSFRYLSKRTATDDPALAGLPEIGAAIELGAGVAYQYEHLRGFVDLRYGVSGHHGLVGETGLDFVAKPTSQLTMSLGPRLSFADRTYMNTYFGVSAAGAAASGLPQYGVSSGFKSAGLEANARFDIDRNWAIESTAGWNRLIGDAGASPVTALGSRDQFTFKLGLIRTFRVNF